MHIYLYVLRQYVHSMTLLGHKQRYYHNCQSLPTWSTLALIISIRINTNKNLILSRTFANMSCFPVEFNQKQKGHSSKTDHMFLLLLSAFIKSCTFINKLKTPMEKSVLTFKLIINNWSNDANRFRFGHNSSSEEKSRFCIQIEDDYFDLQQETWYFIVSS